MSRKIKLPNHHITDDVPEELGPEYALFRKKKGKSKKDRWVFPRQGNIGWIVFAHRWCCYYWDMSHRMWKLVRAKQRKTVRVLTYAVDHHTRILGHSLAKLAMWSHGSTGS